MNRIFFLGILVLCAAAPATQQAKISRDLWAQRNLDLLRDIHQPAEALGHFLWTATFNSTLQRDPYTAKMLALLQKIPRGTLNVEELKQLDQLERYLRLPENDRRLRPLPGNSIDPDKPLVQGNDSFNLAIGLQRVPPGEFEKLAAPVVDQMDAAAQKAGDFSHLALGYFELVTYLSKDKPALANKYVDRMVSILTAHPSLQDPEHGNCDGVDVVSLPQMLLEQHRQADFDRLVSAYPQDLKLDLLSGMVGALSSRDEWKLARQFVDSKIAPVSAVRAKILVADLAGEIAPAAPAVKRRPVRNTMPKSGLAEVELAIAMAHARRGEIDLAGNLKIEALSGSSASNSLAPYQWAPIAIAAHEGGHDDAARAAFDHAIAAMQADPLHAGDDKDRLNFVHEALGVGDFQLAGQLFSTTAEPGGWARFELGRDYRAKGDLRKALLEFDDALKFARQDRGGAGIIGQVALEVDSIGQKDRAAKLLLEMQDHMNGEDFGFGDTAAIIATAVKLDRLDLLEEAYKKADTTQKLLLCIVACHYAEAPDEFKE
jgi:tetratricopeptide (TPR) repeat protein